ncbi:hypothetical protein EDD11_005262 [Mortierella claussenii]|nr:hypothetical protein EDD11_005262 [Mortierella claussenii]
MATKKPRRTRLSPITASLLVLSLLSFSPLTHAQSTTAPLPAQGPAFARTNTRLYVLGGNLDKVFYGQFFSLDLAVAWNTSAPAWTQLNDGPQQSIFPAVFSADQRTMITFHSGTAGFAFRYSLATGQWEPSTLQPVAANLQGVGAVTDPDTGLVYLAGGYTDGTRNNMAVYNFGQDSFTSTTLPNSTALFPNRAYFTNVWTKKRKSILYFGGYDSSLKPLPMNNTITEFVPPSSWTTMMTKGTSPTMRADHCMTANDDGSMVVIYGGRPLGGLPYSGEVFILDTTSQTWKQGVSGPPRVYTTCTIAGDQLLLWGGQGVGDVVAPAAVLIYSLTNNVWMTNYTPPSSYVAVRATESPSSPTLSPTNTPGSSAGGSSSNAGAIAGGVVGGVALICAGVLFFIFWKRQHRGVPVTTTADGDESPGSKHPLPGRRTEDDELQKMRTQLQNQQEQLELQRRLLQLQQQQQQLQFQSQQQQQQQQQQQHFQDPNYSYQPPIFYSTAGSPNAIIVTNVSPVAGMHSSSSPDSIKLVPTHGGRNYSGYVDGNNHYAETHHVVPVVYTPPPVSGGAVTTAMAAQVPASMLEVNAKDENAYWEERIPGNPHALIET